MNDGVIHFIDYPTTTQHINNSFIHEDDHGTIWILPPLGELSFYNSQTQRFEQAYSYDKGNKIYYQAVGMNYMINSHHNLWPRCGSGFDKISFSNGSSQYISNTDGIEVRGLFIDSNGYLSVSYTHLEYLYIAFYSLYLSIPISVHSQEAKYSMDDQKLCHDPNTVANRNLSAWHAIDLIDQY